MAHRHHPTWAFTRPVVLVSLLLGTVLIPVPVAVAAPPEGRAMSCHGQRATLVGTAGADRIKGTRGRDVVAAGRGADLVLGLGGRDVICGGRGADLLDGLGGRDRLFGGAGRDQCFGSDEEHQYHVGCEEHTVPDPPDDPVAPPTDPPGRHPDVPVAMPGTPVTAAVPDFSIGADRPLCDLGQVDLRNAYASGEYTQPAWVAVQPAIYHRDGSGGWVGPFYGGWQWFQGNYDAVMTMPMGSSPAVAYQTSYLYYGFSWWTGSAATQPYWAPVVSYDVQIDTYITQLGICSH